MQQIKCVDLNAMYDTGRSPVLSVLFALHR